MNKKNLKIVFLFVVFMITVLGFILCYRHITDEQKLRGHHTFTQTRNNIKSLGKIVLTTPESGEITMYRQNDFWHFKEAGDYFVNMEALSNFYTMVNESIILSVHREPLELMAKYRLLTGDESQDGNNLGTEVAIYDNEGNLLDDIVLGKRVDAAENQFYARRKGKSYVYVISNVGRFSGVNQAWIPYPLLQISDEFIDSIELDGLNFTRKQLLKMSYDSFKIKNILEAVAFLDYQGIIKKEEFFRISSNMLPKEIRINMEGGVFYNLRIYEIDDDYWLEINLDIEPIAHKDLEPFVRDNKKYYENWVFQLFDDQGEILYGD